MPFKYTVVGCFGPEVSPEAQAELPRLTFHCLGELHNWGLDKVLRVREFIPRTTSIYATERDVTVPKGRILNSTGHSDAALYEEEGQWPSVKFGERQSLDSPNCPPGLAWSLAFAVGLGLDECQSSTACWLHGMLLRGVTEWRWDG